ncbi:MAG: hypothetical protein SVE93_01910, partial [Candidatus Thermoplasmatota archaeon]|nr:hypothetical protein [Candidatus Thermoplasmatota archaeon]
ILIILIPLLGLLVTGFISPLLFAIGSFFVAFASSLTGFCVLAPDSIVGTIGLGTAGITLLLIRAITDLITNIAVSGLVGGLLSTCSSIFSIGVSSGIALGISELVSVLVIFTERISSSVPCGSIIGGILQSIVGIAMLALATLFAGCNVVCYPFNLCWTMCVRFVGSVLNNVPVLDCRNWVRRPLGWS